MKKILIIILLSLYIPIVYAKSEVPDKTIPTNSEEEIEVQEVDTLNLAPNAKSAIMIEASTGKVIYEKNADEQLSMASMTNIMTT